MVKNVAEPWQRLGTKFGGRPNHENDSKNRNVSAHLGYNIGITTGRKVQQEDVLVVVVRFSVDHM